MQRQRLTVAILLSMSVSAFAGCGCPCPCPATPQQPATKHARRPTLPKLPPMGQCVDTPEDVGLKMDRVDGLGVVHLSADAFVDLDPPTRVLAYHLSHAAVAAEAIVYQQRSSLGLTLKAVAEEMAQHLPAMPEPLRPKAETFTRRVFVHKGVHDAWTGAKIAPPFDASELREMLVAAMKDGAKLPGVQSEAGVGALVDKLRPLLFDPGFEPFARSLSDTAPKFPDAYGEPLKPVIASLESAGKVASGSERVAIEQLVAYLSSGDLHAYQRHVEAEAGVSPVSLRMGVFPSRQFAKEMWASVTIDDAAMTPTMTKLAVALPDLHTLAFSSSEPVGALPPRAGIPLTFTGAAAPTMPPAKLLAGVSGPAQAWVWTPVLDASVQLHGLAVKKGFIPDPERAADFERCLPHASRARFILRAAMGSGSQDRPLAVSTRDWAVIETAIQSLAATVAAWDPKVVDVGLLPDATCADTADALVPVDYLLRLGNASEGSKMLDPALRASALIVRYALAQGALREVSRAGHVHLLIVDRARWRVAVKSLLTTLLDRDGNAAQGRLRALLRRYGDDVVEPWRKSAHARVQAAGLPSHLVFLAPRVKAIRDADGAIVDATLVDSLGLTETALVDAGKMEMP